jgi:mRNA interferase MazF
VIVPAPRPTRGELWWADLSSAAAPPTSGETSGRRPVLVVSTSLFNAWPVGLVIVVPLTTRDRGLPHQVPVLGTGLTRPSWALTEQLRSITQRRLAKRLGVAEPATVKAVDDWLRRLTGL